MSVYKVTGIVEAADGTFYEPLFYGSRQQACNVANAILVGARLRDEAASVVLSRPDGRVETRRVGGLEEVTV